jgi:hypothetical protein
MVLSVCLLTIHCSSSRVTYSEERSLTDVPGPASFITCGLLYVLLEPSEFSVDLLRVLLFERGVSVFFCSSCFSCFFSNSAEVSLSKLFALERRLFADADGLERLEPASARSV